VIVPHQAIGLTTSTWALVGFINTNVLGTLNFLKKKKKKKKKKTHSGPNRPCGLDRLLERRLFGSDFGSGK
jgi:hypothetical protein